MTEEKKKEYNPTLALLYDMKYGSWSLPLDAKGYDQFMKHIEIGGRIVVKRASVRKNDKSPHAFLEFIPKAKVDEMGNKRKAPSDDI